MKIAVVGLGAWSLKILESLPRRALPAAIVTQRPDAANVVPRDCEIVGDLNELWGLKIDGIIVANEAENHLPTLQRIWSHAPRMPVFVEKPVGMCLADVASLSRAYPDTEWRILLVDHVQLFNRNLHSMKAELGEVRPNWIRGLDGNAGPIRQNCSALWDYGPHAVAIALFITGPLASTDAIRVRYAQQHHSQEGTRIDFELEIGATTVATLAVGNNFTEKSRRYSAGRPDNRRSEFDGLALCEPPPLAAALEIFLAAIETGKVPRHDPRWGWVMPLAVTRALSLVEKSLAAQNR